MNRYLTDRFFADFDNFFDGFLPLGSDVKIDIKDYDDKFEVVAETFGYEKDDIKIKYEKGVLSLCGEVKKDKDEKVKFLHKEIKPRQFCRRFELEEVVDVDGIEAELVDGILTVTLPKSEKLKPREITIK